MRQEMSTEEIAKEVLEEVREKSYLLQNENQNAVDLVSRVIKSETHPLTEYKNMPSLLSAEHLGRAVESIKTAIDGYNHDDESAIEDMMKLAIGANRMMVQNQRSVAISNNIMWLIGNVCADLNSIIYEYMRQSGLEFETPFVISDICDMFTMRKGTDTVILSDYVLDNFIIGTSTRIMFNPDKATVEAGREMLSNVLTVRINGFINEALTSNLLQCGHFSRFGNSIRSAHSRDYKDDTIYCASNAEWQRKVYNDVYKIVTSYFASDMYIELVTKTVSNIIDALVEMAPIVGKALNIFGELEEEYSKFEEAQEDNNDGQE